LRAMAIRWQNAGSDAKSLICRVSSAVEQRFCKPQAGGSIPSPGTKKTNTFKGQGRPPRVVRATLPLGGPQHATSCLPFRKRSNHRQSSA
jgi:hypothetical protein